MVLPLQTFLQYLTMVLMNGCHAGAAKIAAAANSAWVNATSARIANLHIKFHMAKEPGTYLSSGKLGRMIKGMQMFEDAAPASDLPPPQAAKQLAAFVASLVPPGQQGGADWVDLLHPLEWQARRRQADSKPAAAGLGYAGSAPPSTSQHLEEEDGRVHLAVGFLLRELESAGMLKQHWRDSRHSGIMCSPYAPNFTGFVAPAEAWASVVRHPTILSPCAAKIACVCPSYLTAALFV